MRAINVFSKELMNLTGLPERARQLNMVNSHLVVYWSF